ncbi:MAG: hypothetical protein ACRDCE_22720 [Cetobacterium sp.]|uniref:hypothetical protein n=1 Tax=Cetobacterium sp. TaxID=2071632 RepID=UPI003EE65E0F
MNDTLKIFVTDIEADNLFQDITKFHCAWVINPITGEEVGFRPHQFQEYINYLAQADVIVGHNVCDFDIPALIKLGGDLKPKAVFDTLVLSRMLDPDRPQGHGLKAWGKFLGILKGEYGEEENAWDVFSEDMYEYCQQDVRVTVELYKFLCGMAAFDWKNPPISRIDFSELNQKYCEGK